MAIKYSKLKAQIKPFKPEVKKGFIFLATEDQQSNFIFSVAEVGSKRRLLSSLRRLIRVDEDWRREFAL